MSRELRPLTRNWKLEESPPGVTIYSSDRAIAAVAGMGKKRAEIATHAALNLGPVREVISAGWAGAINAEVPVGAVLFASAVIDEETGEKFEAEQESDSGNGAGADALLLTVNHVVSAAEKRSLRVKYAADMVDMEAGAVARVARSKGIPFLAMKGISDAHDFDLPGMEKFATPDGQFRERAFAAHIVLRPWLWKPAFSLAGNSGTAARNLCAELERYLAQDEKKAK